jgi:electron transport complex protein RnfB
MTLEAATERIDALLPQTQCTRCGYGGCRPYAAALARGEAAINRCPPGGEAGIMALAKLLGRPRLPLDPQCGTAQDPAVAWIDESACIGCARCLPVCPVDAIIGARRHLHSVIEAECTGCELCVPSCPVDCILMRPRAKGEAPPAPGDNRLRYARHLTRLERQASMQATLLAERKRSAQGGSG